jgi:multidrug efflux pump subunit AcrB
MNLAKSSIEKNVVTWSLSLVLLVAGWVTFGGLPRLEDPEFTIKEALITTPYPGASAEEVEEEVSDVIEQAVQEMGQLKRVESTSKRGVSVVKAYILDKYSRPEFPQIWDELRKKVGDYQAQLPPGAGPSQVNDDFGDVYGVYLALTGDGYSMAELHEYAKLLQKELTLATDVKRVELYGVQSEAIYVEMSRPKMAALGISQQDIHAALTAKNIPADAGRLLIRPEYIPINPSGEFMSEQEFGELLVSAPGADTLVYLKDVATVRRGYVDPPQNIMRFNGEPAIALGISTVSGGNVVVMGDAINEKLRRLQAQTPLGMELHKISMQSEAVTTAIDGFMVTLGQAVAIVVVVLLLFMGLRSGLIIGTILFLTISGTFLFMGTMGVTLERISLGALIIALGMLVDNAIVVVDGMRVRIEAGQDATEAASDVVGQTAIPLLGATVVAILAFAAIGTSKDATGEFCRSLFTVILISLSLSWVVAVTTTPLLAKIALKVPKKKTDEAPKDPYAGALFQGYKRLLTSAIQFRWVTVGAVLAIFVASLVGFGSVDQMFFPNSTKPQFFIEFYFPEGTHIRETEARLAKVEEYLRSREGVTDVATAVGGGDLRFILTYVPIAGSSANGAIFVGVTDYRLIDGMTAEVREQVEELVPGAVIAVKKFLLGPGEGGKIQLRISGQDRAELRRLASTAKQILREGGGVAVRDEWKNSVKVVRPYLAEDRARQLGITRPNLAQALQASYDGYRTGVYREADELLPILARAPEYERQEASSLQDLQIWSPAAGRMIPMRQVLTDIRTESEDSVIWRRNRTTTVKIHADPDGELPSVLFARVKGPIEEALGVDAEAYLGRPVTEHTSSTLPIVDSDQVPLAGRPGYFIAWGGEAEDSARAGGALAVSIPIFIGMMILTVIALFNAIKQTLIIWLTVPLAIIGVTVGLLAFGQPFGFMALLGLLSLVGMLIKNAIVLIDEIDTQIGTGKDRFQSVIDSGLSRLMPVSMAAATTILGMIPLLQDAFFVSMAVTIMVGLLFATILTLVIVPVLYAIFFRIPYGTGSEVPA